LQSTDRVIPFLLVPAHDESVSSWLVRLARKHYCNVHDFCEYYCISHILKSDIDLMSDLSCLQWIIPSNIKIPNQLIQKISDLHWKNGRSDWLVEPNKSGSARSNSFTKLCVSCLRKNGYYQLKWKLELVEGCSICSCLLIYVCPKCKKPISPLKADFKYSINLNIDPIYCCWFCEFDLRKARIKKSDSDLNNKINLVHRAYEEEPINRRFLEQIKLMQ
jgi:hypothetical protein